MNQPARPGRLRLAAWARAVPLRPRTRRGAGVLAALLLTTLWITSAGAHAGVQTWPRRQVLDAIRWVESRDRPDAEVRVERGCVAPVDLVDLVRADREAVVAVGDLGGTYQDCRRRGYAERVVDAYMRRHAPEAWAAGDGQRIARVHNGGPRGHEKEATVGYWRRVRSRLPAPR